MLKELFNESATLLQKILIIDVCVYVCVISVCNSGQWTCTEKNCPATCSVVGGAHVTSYDGKSYTFHGDCSYVLTKVALVICNTASIPPHTHTHTHQTMY